MQVSDTPASLAADKCPQRKERASPKNSTSCSSKPARKPGSTSRSDPDFSNALMLLRMDALVCTSRYTVIHAAAVPQDRCGAAGDGDALVGEAGGHGGREPEADLRPVQLAAAGGQWMRLLGTNSASSAHTRA